VRYVDGKASVFTTSAGLHSNRLFALAGGIDGTIWIGSNNGVDSIKDGLVARDPVPVDLAGSLVISLYSDSSNTLWIGTFGRGLFRLENGRYTQYTTHQGLPSDSVNSIVEDGARNLWVGSDHDVVRLSRQDLDAVAAGSSRTMTPLVFGSADGMKSAETSGGTHPSVWRARDGRLWFPTTRGVVVVDPMRLLLNDRPLPARVEDMVVDDAQASLNVPVRLQPGTRRIEIRYTAPSLSAPERTRFRYRLDGYDEQWVAGGVQQIAQYTNLSPGHYIFHVNAGSTTGGWSVQEATIGFDLVPYFYQTTWFKLLYWLTGLLVLWAAYRLRVNWLHAKAAVLEERQRIARDIHDSLAQGLSAIIFHTQAALYSLKKAPEMTSTHMTSVHDLAVSSLDEARYSVWDLSPAVLDPKNLGESISSMARLLVRGRIESLEINSSGTEWPLGAAANHHVVLIAQEAISNAIRHGHARNIWVNLEYFSEALHLSVTDNGIGFTPSPEIAERVRGYGMRNMHFRADRLGAALEVKSAPGSGTTISLHVRKLGRFRKVWYRLIGNTKARIDR
jgi:signal transduction histidine kinase